jgi:hypothetical protein
LPRHRDSGELTSDSGSKRPDPKDAKVPLAEKSERVCLVRIIKRIHGCRGWTIETSNQRKRATFSIHQVPLRSGLMVFNLTEMISIRLYIVANGEHQTFWL